MTVCQQNLYHTQKFQKLGHNKGVKPQSYVPGEKIWLNSKYLKTKQNCQLEAKFLSLFQVLHPVNKQAYKLKLPKKKRIHNVFHVSLLEQDTLKMGQVSDMQLEFEASNDKKYEDNGIQNSAVYARKSIGQLLELYYLALWKGYPKEENI